MPVVDSSEKIMATADIAPAADNRPPAEVKKEPEVNKLFRMVM